MSNALVPSNTRGEITIVRDDEPPRPQASGALVPSTLPEAMKLAELMARARLVPQHLQGQPADCLMVIEQASRWGLSPFAVAQSTSVIQGKLMYEGKLVAAVVNARGELAERLSYEYSGEGDRRAVRVSGRMRGESDPRTVEVRIADVRTNNRVWQTQPDQQLMYHGARVWARRHMPELMLGVYSAEEFAERMEDQRPKAQDRRPPRSVVSVAPSASSPAPSTAPPSEAFPDVVDERVKASPGQVRSMNIELGKIMDALKAASGSADERASKLMWLSWKLGRPIESSKDIFADEVQTVIEAARAGEVP